MKGESEGHENEKETHGSYGCSTGLYHALPTPAWATQPQENPKVTVNDSVVVFAGHEWWVVGDGTTGINQQPGNITLLAKEDVYGDSVFRQGHGAEFDGSQYDSENDMYYAANPDGSTWISPTEVRGEHAATGDGGYCRGIFRKRAGCHCGQSPARRRNGGSAKCRWHCRPGDRPKALGSVSGGMASSGQRYHPHL